MSVWCLNPEGLDSVGLSPWQPGWASFGCRNASMAEDEDVPYLFNKMISKGLPQQAEVAQGVPGTLRPRIFLTFRHYKGGRSSAIRTGLLYPRRNPWYSFSEVESTSGHMVQSGEPRKKSPVTPPGIDPGTVRLVAQCLNHYAIPGPSYLFNTALQLSKISVVVAEKC